MAILKGTIITLIMGALITGALIPVSAYENNQSITVGAILPHHLLVEKEIDNLYQKLSEEYSFERVIVISPNHFNSGIRYIQSPNSSDLTEKKVSSLEPDSFKNEHGIANHLPFINKYFPNSEIISIIIKKDTPKKHLNKLAEEMTKLNKKNTLIIASIDFSHYLNEEKALKDDTKIILRLEEWSKNPQITLNEIKELSKTDTSDNPESIAMDSPESLFVFLKYLHMKESINFNFQKRTSAHTIIGLENPAMNTSHIFAYFN